MRRRAALALVALGVLLPLAPPASASFKEVKASTVVFERTTRGPASLKVAAFADSGGRPSDLPGKVSFTGIVGQRSGRGGRIVPFVLAAGAADPAPAVYAGGSRYGCSQYGCGAIGSVGATVSTAELSDRGMDDPEALDRVFVVISSAHPSLQFEANGWKAVVRGLAFRFKTHTDSQAAVTFGLMNGAADSDVFASADLAGGALGSISVGQLPCGTASAGRGSLHNAAGVSAEATCLAGTQRSTVGLFSPARTTWTFSAEGAAAGLSGTQSGRFLVIDVPGAASPRR